MQLSQHTTHPVQTMKTYLTLSAALLLATTPLAHAGTKARKHIKTVETRQANYVDRVIVQDQAPAKPTQDARGWIGSEVGNDAPHEERTPSAHPELFRADR